MAHLSKHQLPPKQLEQLFARLNHITASLDQNDAEFFFSELLGSEEKIMLAKRFAAIAMLNEGNSIYRVAQLLCMSPSTIERMKLKLEIGKYRRITRLLKENEKRYMDFWDTLDIILQAGMPPMGRGRWKSFRK